MLTDLAGAIVELYAFDAYGNAIGFDPSVALTEFLYSGEQFDSKIGQQYLRQRYYDPATGRFNRLDPFFGNLNDPQSLHKYLYTHDDPVNGIDPSGLMSMASVSMACSIGGALIGTSAGAYIGYSQTGTLFSGKTIGYAILGGLAGFGIGSAVGGIIGNLCGAKIGLDVSTVFFTSCKVFPKIYRQAALLFSKGRLGAGGSISMFSFAGGVIAGVVTAICCPNEYEEPASAIALGATTGTTADVIYRTVVKVVYGLKFPSPYGYIPPILQEAQVFALGFNLGYFGTKSVEYWTTELENWFMEEE
ncbi:MAG: hypothetical protein LBE13_04295 [Bacteroidales bacterium]|nr:hypothetical protein [Bacteroidales bacterium]